jgi:Calpain family cysteine protease
MLRIRDLFFISSGWLLSLIALLTFASDVRAQTAKSSDQQRFVQAVLSNFANWDSNHDDRLDAKEMTAVVQDPKVKGEAAAAAATLKMVFDGNKKNPPVSRRFFESDSSNLAKLTLGFKESESRIQAAAGKPIFTTEGPKLSEFHQGGRGDCYLIAATGALVSNDPKRISRMFECDSEKSDYRVNFPDGFSVSTSTLTEGELGMRGSPTENGLWLRMLEKAWGVRKMLRTTGKVDLTVDPIDVIDGPIPHDITMEAMTGHRANRYDLGGSNGKITPVSDLRSAIREGVLGGHLMTADVVRTTVPGITEGHCYAVLGYDSKSDALSIWNPQAIDFTPSGPEGRDNGYKTVKGTFGVPLVDFQVIFEDIKIESSQAKKAEEKTFIH